MKKVLRSEITSILNSMTEVNRCSQSDEILSKIINHEKFKESQRIAVFIGMPEEIKTGKIIEQIFKLGKKCFIPRIILKSKHMDMVEMKSLEEIENLPTIKWGIRQPETVTREAMDDGGLDFMIVPGVAFGPDNSRLGHGAGYYDNYFARYKAKFNRLPFLAGVCFKEQIHNSIPMGQYDVYVDHVITG
ncbi:5-formyltetrahydrofolate cyclo-ligase-like isoform X2 [Panonychus citri]|nr:5-formyltetrahydrofolate cyclo-ligase-like isoform X2 [Panonychus citri]XP_053206762.1 5-formyltetrahydrofolate cyclo-ligase-like isoform X2 [Panonychus citri]